MLGRTASLRRIVDMLVEDNRGGDLRIEATFDYLVANVVNSPGLQSSNSFNLAIVKL